MLGPDHPLSGPDTRTGFRGVTFDRRGHGRSQMTGQRYDFDTLSDDLRLVIEQLDLRDLALVAHSMGSGEVVHYLARHGTARVRKVVLLAPTTPFLTKTSDNPLGIERALLEANLEKMSRDCH
jgi:non-heme chloroperoxidase